MFASSRPYLLTLKGKGQNLTSGQGQVKHHWRPACILTGDPCCVCDCAVCSGASLLRQPVSRRLSTGVCWSAQRGRPLYPRPAITIESASRRRRRWPSDRRHRQETNYDPSARTATKPAGRRLTHRSATGTQRLWTVWLGCAVPFSDRWYHNVTLTVWYGWVSVTNDNRRIRQWWPAR